MSGIQQTNEGVLELEYHCFETFIEIMDLGNGC